MTRESATHVLLIGYGNTLRSDESIGWRAVESLGHSGLPPHVTVLALDQIDTDLVSLIAASNLVVFVHAAQEGEPGEIRCSRVGATGPEAGSTLPLTPATIMSIVRTLRSPSPEAFEVTMTGESFDDGEHLSPSCEAALPSLVEMLREMATLEPAS